MEQGIKLKEFIEMWTADGTKLVEQEKQVIDGTIWLLYAVYFPKSTCDYGRHMGMILKVDKESEVILMHDLTNLSGEVNDNYRQGLDAWFMHHAGKY